MAQCKKQEMDLFWACVITSLIPANHILSQNLINERDKLEQLNRRLERDLDRLKVPVNVITSDYERQLGRETIQCCQI